MATQHVVVFCSTGLASSERRSLEQAIGQLGRCQYHGDLTDRTTHLVAHDGAAPSEKVMCAKKLRLPIVRPKWIVDSAANGGTVLLPLDAKYLSRVPMDENEPPQQSEGAPQQPRQLQALPQPAVLVLPPAEGRAVRCGDQGMRITSCHRHHVRVRQRVHQLRR